MRDSGLDRVGAGATERRRRPNRRERLGQTT